MDRTMLDATQHQILELLPQTHSQLARLRAIIDAGAYPTVTVIGKYNHGKSRLLNELMGEDFFAVADKRETTTQTAHIQHDIRWLDAPGLDADVATRDDQHADDAIWHKADVRLFVHSLREGELDPHEVALFQSLSQDKKQTGRQTLLVLTQVDQIPDPEVLQGIVHCIQEQIPDGNGLSVSATRHRQGLEKSKPLLVQRSGIPELQQALHETLQHVPEIRIHEKQQIFSSLNAQLNALQHTAQTILEQQTSLQQQQREHFDRDLNTVLRKVCEDLAPVLEVGDVDHSLEPDSFANMYKITAGKRDRNRIQVAYSQACIAINSHLIRYGVVGLPEAQKTNVRSIDSVIIAVLGVSVKLRKELRQMFFDASSLNRMRQAFAHYFELSSDRQDLKTYIAQLEQQLEAIQQTLIALQDLEHLSQHKEGVIS